MELHIKLTGQHLAVLFGLKDDFDCSFHHFEAFQDSLAGNLGFGLNDFDGLVLFLQLKPNLPLPNVVLVAVGEHLALVGVEESLLVTAQ